MIDIYINNIFYIHIEIIKRYKKLNSSKISKHDSELENESRSLKN